MEESDGRAQKASHDECGTGSYHDPGTC
jgi:hypothetical protein